MDEAAGHEFSSVIWEKLSGHSALPLTNCNLGKVNKNSKNTETATGPTVRTKIFYISLSGFGNYVFFFFWKFVLTHKKKIAISYTFFSSNFRHLFHISPMLKKIIYTLQRHSYITHFTFFNKEMRFRSSNGLELETHPHLRYDIYLSA